MNARDDLELADFGNVEQRQRVGVALELVARKYSAIERNRHQFEFLAVEPQIVLVTGPANRQP